MKTEDCQVVLARRIKDSRITAPAATTLGQTGTSILVMARSYESDGGVFLASGDPVNALASFWYASGWLDFGCAYGILANGDHAGPCIFFGPFDRIPPGQQDKLVEKTSRYARLLDTARSSVLAAAEPGTPAYALAGRVLCIAETYAGFGRCWQERGSREQALAAFSYGHGWLDAGVMAGLFSITANRDIFTV